MKILVADDDAAARMMLDYHLTEWGMEVVEADDGVQALELLQAPGSPRMAILDWMMPGLTGPEICRRLLADGDRALTYTVLLTARTDTDDLVAALDSGAHSFLTKPVCIPVLRSHVEVGRRLLEAEEKLARYATQMEALAGEYAQQAVASERLARTDQLTGLPNRRGFLEEAEKELRRSLRYNRPLSVLALDIDHFKRINDTWGHAAGDQTLQVMARCCRDVVREGDIIGRIGGEEFAVILPETSTSQAIETAERLRSVIEAVEVTVDQGPIRLTISIGVAGFASHDTSFEAILTRADANLYRAKRSGRNRVVAGLAGSGSTTPLPFWVDQRHSTDGIYPTAEQAVATSA